MSIDVFKQSLKNRFRNLREKVNSHYWHKFPDDKEVAEEAFKSLEWNSNFISNKLQNFIN